MKSSAIVAVADGQLAEMEGRGVSRSLAGGLGPAGGVGLEGQVLAWLAAYSLAEEQLPYTWVPAAQVVAIGSQTAREIDDIAALTAANGHLLVQSKKAMGLGRTRSSPLGKAVGQVVGQYLLGVPDGRDGRFRQVDPERDRLLIVTDRAAPERVRNGLVQAVDQMARLSSLELPFTEVQGNRDAIDACGVILEHLRRELRERQDGEPTESSLRGLLGVLRVRVLYLDEGGHDRQTACGLLGRVLFDSSRASAAWNSLEVICQELARDRTLWASREELARRLRHDRFELRRDVSASRPQASAHIDPGTAVQRSAIRPVTAWNALQLGVHRAITAGSATQPTPPELTVYVRRAHDARLLDLLAGPPARPVMVMLVGGSSTGKTRAAYEAVHECLPDWPLLRPVDADELARQLTSGEIGPRTVLWLNEAQAFLRDHPKVAAALRKLLADDLPVVVVGTMWAQYWKELTATPAQSGPDVHHQTRELLVHDTVRLEVPEVFAAEDLAELHNQLGADRRLEVAATAARADGKVIQVLAGGPALVDRYEHPADSEDRYGKAVVTAAMDIRRLGHESPIRPALLAKVASAYLDPSDRADPPAGWFDAGLANAAGPVHGIAAATPCRHGLVTGPPDGYELHDYLYQYARMTRSAVPILAAVWDALTVEPVSLADRIRFARQAEWRSLYRQAAVLARPAAEAGNLAAMQLLASRLEQAGHRQEAERWWWPAAQLGGHQAVLTLAQHLDEDGRRQDAEDLLRRAADIGLGSAAVVLATRLDKAGGGGEAESVLRRAAACGDTGAIQRLAERLDEAGRGREAESVLRQGAETGNKTFMLMLATRFEKAERDEQAEHWLQRAAQSDDTSAGLAMSGTWARHAMIRLANRADQANRSDDADQWWRRIAQAGDATAMSILAARLHQADRTEEAEQWQRKALDAGCPIAITRIEQQGGNEEDVQRLLRDLAEAGHIMPMGRLIERLKTAGRSDKAEQWLRQAATTSNPLAAMLLAHQLEETDRGEEANWWLRRTIELEGTTAARELAERLDKTNPAEAERLRRYGIEPGGATAAPW